VRFSLAAIFAGVQRISEYKTQIMILSLCEYFRLIIVTPNQVPFNTHLERLRASPESVEEDREFGPTGRLRQRWSVGYVSKLRSQSKGGLFAIQIIG